MNNRQDFSEIGHTGGNVTFTIHCNAEGKIAYQIGYSHKAAHPASLCGIYAHPDGFACGNIQMGGIGDPWNPPPYPSCVAVLMASDSQGKFGHECPDCHGHFRSENLPSRFPLTCPYCGLRTSSYHFLTPPQIAYITRYIERLESGMAQATPNSITEVVIDMNVVADSVKAEPRPDFYYTSITQQTEYKCSKCNCYNDIRGKYGYCSSCGWRNNGAALRAELEKIREGLNSKNLSPEDAVKRAVSAFDSAARNYIEQVTKNVPMLNARKNELNQLLFHNLDKFDALLQKCLGISLLKSMDGDRIFVRMMFFRRHVYEHDGGVATQRYVDESGDTTIPHGTLIRETLDNVHRFLGNLNRMFSAFESDFHELFPPEEFCIRMQEQRKSRMKKP